MSNWSLRSSQAKKRSSLCIDVAPPTITIPRSKSSHQHTRWKMGSVRAISWHEESGGGTSTRVLELGILGIGGGDVLPTPVDFKLIVTQPRHVHLAPISLEGYVSPVRFVIRYTDWLLVKAILRENVGDVREFSNLEREYEGLVEGARVVRYGGKKEASTTKKSPISASLSLSAFAVKLVRDDDSIADMQYDMTEVIMKEVSVVYSSTEDGSVNFDVSCGSFTLTDLGDEARRRMKGEGTTTAAFHDIVKGYAREEKIPEIVVTYKRAGGASDPMFSLGFYHLNLFGLVRPIVELAEFLQGCWSVGEEGGDIGEIGARSRGSDSAVKVAAPISPKKVGTTRIKLVAHKPQFHLLVDEGDVKSKALVLRGLAVVDIVTTSEFDAPNDLHDTKHKNTTTGLVKVDSLESFVSKDITGGTRAGVALLDPLFGDMSLSFVSRPLHPTIRVINLDVEPLATSVSYSDFDMIQQVVDRWKKERGESSKRRIDLSNRSTRGESLTFEAASPPEKSSGRTSAIFKSNPAPVLHAPPTDSFHNVTFDTVKLGLVLRKRGRLIIVEEVKNPKHAKFVDVGSWLYAVDGNPVRRVPFETVVKMLQTLPRPLEVTFGKTMAKPRTESSEAAAQNESFSSSPTYTLQFYSLPTGLALRPSPHDGSAIIGDITAAFAISTSPTMSSVGGDGVEVKRTDEDTVRRPKVGAFIIEVNGVNVLGKAFEDVIKVCTGSDVGISNGLGPILTLKFSEIPSRCLPPKTTFTLTLSAVKATVINDDLGETPTLRAAIGNIAVKVDQSVNFDDELERGLARISRGTDGEETLASFILKNKTMVFAVEGQISLDCYNSRVVDWEPVIEPCACGVGFVSSSSANGSENKEVGIEVDHLMLNVTDAFFEVIGEMLIRNKLSHEDDDDMRIATKKTALTAGIAAKLARNKDEDRGCFVKNMTGYDVTVAVEGDGEERRVIKCGEAIDWALQSQGMKRGDVKVLSATLTFGEFMGMDPVKGLPMTKVGTVRRPLRRGRFTTEATTDEDLTLSWVVGLSGNKRVITISGGWRVMGLGDFEVGVARGCGNEIEIVGRGGEEDGAALPMQVGSTMDIR